MISLSLKDNLRIISDMAFEAMDLDDSGGLDVNELKCVMDSVASKMGLRGTTTKQDL